MELDFCRGGFYAAVIVESDVDTVAESSEGFFVGTAADFYQIFLRNVGAGFS